MTLPDERLRALHQARDLLRGLLDPKQTPRVPLEVRRWASRVLKHYPLEFEIYEMRNHRLLGGKRRD
jgi:hypothetical protein